MWIVKITESLNEEIFTTSRFLRSIKKPIFIWWPKNQNNVIIHILNLKSVRKYNNPVVTCNTDHWITWLGYNNGRQPHLKLILFRSKREWYECTLFNSKLQHKTILPFSGWSLWNSKWQRTNQGMQLLNTVDLHF